MSNGSAFRLLNLFCVSVVLGLKLLFLFPLFRLLLAVAAAAALLLLFHFRFLLVAMPAMLRNVSGMM
jgi:hypothetical protein